MAEERVQRRLAAILAPFPFQDSYLLAKGKDFYMERRAADEDFAEDGERHQIYSPSSRG